MGQAGLGKGDRQGSLGFLIEEPRFRETQAARAPDAFDSRGKNTPAEKARISSETVTASLITAGQMFLRLGLATVIVVGSRLILHGETTLFA